MHSSVGLATKRKVSLNTAGGGGGGEKEDAEPLVEHGESGEGGARVEHAPNAPACGPRQTSLQPTAQVGGYPPARRP
jgi:hypothetical protein